VTSKSKKKTDGGKTPNRRGLSHVKRAGGREKSRGSWGYKKNSYTQQGGLGYEGFGAKKGRVSERILRLPCVEWNIS